MASQSVLFAIDFLTHPLDQAYPQDLIVSLREILRSTLLSNRRYPLTLSLSTTSLPPRPLYAACVACALSWAEWIGLLGNCDFDLVIDLDAVRGTYFNAPESKTFVVWQRSSITPSRRSGEREIPISKLGQQSQIRGPSALKCRTLAQELLEQDQDSEAQEIFSLLCATGIVSPTPIQEVFHPGSFDIPSSPESSRPSSRSSTFSTCSSDYESVTSASSASSLAFPPFSKSSSTFSRPPPGPPTKLPIIVVDKSKSEKTKFIYQGGMSTVLTGGVMLGSVSAASRTRMSPPKPTSVPLYKAPIGGRKLQRTTDSVASTAKSWRRAAARPTPPS